MIHYYLTQGYGAIVGRLSRCVPLWLALKLQKHQRDVAEARIERMTRALAKRVEQRGAAMRAARKGSSRS